MKELVENCLRSSPLLPWFFLVLGFYLVEEFVLPSKDDPPTTANRVLNCACGLVVCSMVFIIKPLFNIEVSFITRHFGHGLIPITFFSGYPAVTFAISVAVFLVVQDLCFYLWHRTQHKISILWHIHAVHHSDRNLNCTSYMRQSWVDGLLQLLFVNIPCILILDIPMQAQYDAYLISAAWNFFGHSSLRLNLGSMTAVVTGPQLHRLHHSLLPRHHDKNFAQFFPIWDILFGTYVPPERHEYPPTGLDHEGALDSLSLLVSWPFRQWIRHFSR